MLSSAQLKKIVTEARPLIERQLDLAEQIAGLRDVVSSAGGDWSQLKALIKAQIQDERDEGADGKRVKKILDRADYATTYADMLGLSAFAKMNEENFFAEDIPEHDAETGEVIEPQHGLRTDTAAQTVQPHPAVATSETLTESVESSVGGSGDSNAAPALIPEPSASHHTDALTSGAAAHEDADTAAPEADHSKPNPICRDPDDCGVYASWAMPCETCKRAALAREAA
jgi:hypothetical protein